MDMLGIAVVGSLVLAGSAVVAWIKFFMDMGSMRKEASSAMTMATAAHGQTTILRDEISAFKVENAHEHGSFMGIETRLNSTLSDLRADIRSRTDRLARVLDRKQRSA